MIDSTPESRDERIGVEVELILYRKTATAFWFLALVMLGCGDFFADSRNFYEWSAVAPEIVVGRILGVEDRTPVAVAEQVLKGNVVPGEEFLIDIRSANRSRMSHRAKLRLLQDQRYLFLMKRSSKDRGKWPFYELVRGVDGARELPQEGEEALLDAVRTFIELNDIEDHERLWEQHSELLESVNPVVLKTALEQYTKFRRGSQDMIPAILPLTSHPSPGIRSQAVELIGQIYEDAPEIQVKDTVPVKGELIALARRDGNVEVRIAATIAVSHLPGEEPIRVLRTIARDDPDQLVRYTAQKILLEEENHQVLKD